MSKKILGLDLGTTSIGWAFVKEAQATSETSTIERLGVRVNPLTTDEQTNFEKGKPFSVNAQRTTKRTARRTLQRYKQRRVALIETLLTHKIITPQTALAENDKNTTHSTFELRSKAAKEKIDKAALARVLLMINKKRGYKSSRKTKNEEDGQAIDGMSIAKRLYDENLTPAQLCLDLLLNGNKTLPDFYRSDLMAELDAVWNYQKRYHPEILTEDFRKKIEGKAQRATAATFWGEYNFNTAEIKGNRDEKKIKTYELRSMAINTPLDKEELAFVITEINSGINNSSGYLGAISDRSKELYFNKLTVGQYLYAQLQDSPHTRLKNQVFYRQDYLDEFETVWETQAQFHPELTPALKADIRDTIIFYQRKLKSQKWLVSYCEFESKKTEVTKEGKTTTKTIGYKVAPKSSPLFQEFKIWQTLNNLEIKNKKTKATSPFDQDAKQLLFDELNIKGNITKDKALDMLGYTSKEYDLNYSVLEGNRTNQALYEAYLKILEVEGYDVKEILKIKSNKDEIILKDLDVPATEIKELVRSILHVLNINTAILHFDAEHAGKAFEQQPSYQLWHLLHAYEEDKSQSGNEHLYKLLHSKFGFAPAHAKILANIALPDDYGSLSAKAMRNIFPHIKENNYSDACSLAGYNHSSFLTRDENDNRPLKDKLDLLPKNSLRNPVVEKILNQMVNVINAIIADPELGKPDEIRIELARELKKNIKERADAYASSNKSNANHEAIRQILIKEDGIINPTRNDIIRYKLYQELKDNGYKTIYSNTYIPRGELFTKAFDIEHIIPKALLFDDSFSNKTICERKVNLDKGDACAMDFIGPYFGEDKTQDYLDRIETLYQLNKKNKDEGISKAKYLKLKMAHTEIGQGFIERDLRDSQYIAKKAKQMLLELCKTVVATTGSITSRLRDDWELVNVMQELNIDKYRKQGLTENIERKDGNTKERIIDWTKRNDHRHHAMDALTVAFTKHNHIQYLNYLNARKNEKHKMHSNVLAIEQKETELITDSTGKKKRKFKLPVHNFRAEAKKHLESILVSIKAKNKVTTRNINKFKTKAGQQTKIELTPRGQLHEETIYGRLKQYVTKEEKVGAKFNEETINTVASPQYRNALLQRLKENNNDPQKAFTGKNALAKNPIHISPTKTVPEKLTLVSLEDTYTIRKDITPENFKDLKSINKIIDVGVRNIITQRFTQYNSNPKEAFANLDKNPIWLNKEKGIVIKRATITGISNAEALHHKKDHLGNFIHDNNGNKIPADFVRTGNNHHVAIYRDAEGNLQDNIVSFYEAVERSQQRVPIVDKNYNKHIGWQFLFTMKQNEYFIFPSNDLDPHDFDLTHPVNNRIFSKNLFRVQTISIVKYGNNTVRDFKFRHHFETTVEDKKELKDISYKQIKSLPHLDKILKVRINHIGKIIHVGEY